MSFIIKMENLNYILNQAEMFVSVAKYYEIEAKKNISPEFRSYPFIEGTYYLLKALYEQNKAIITLLNK